MSRKARKAIILIFILSFCVCFLMSPVPSSAQINFFKKTFPSREISNGWQYRWGDSPKNKAGLPVWIFDDLHNPAWNSFQVPGLPHNNHNFRNVWVRVKLPQGNWEDPGLFFMTNDQQFQVFLANKLIYQFGDIDGVNQNKSPGSPWHIIPLPVNYQNKIISFRMHSTFPRTAGLLRFVQLGSRSEQQMMILRDSIDYFILACLFVFLGLTSIFIFASGNIEQKSGLILGFSSLCAGVWLTSETNMRQLLFDIPMEYWQILAIGSFYLIPVGFCAFVEQIFGGRLKPVLRALWQIYLLFIFITVILDLTNVLTLAATLSFFYLLLAVTIIVILGAIIEAGMKGNHEARIFGTGIIILSVSAIYDILGWYFHILPWKRYITHWGLFILVLSLVYLLRGRIVTVYEQLKDYSQEIQSKNEMLSHIWLEVKKSRDEIAEWNKDLEKRVVERTEELEATNRELKNTLETLRRTQDKLVQSEKMVALGSLVAGFAHEINTPIGISVTAASHLAQKTKEFQDLYLHNQMKRSDLENYFGVSNETSKVILTNLERSANLVRSFKQVAVDQSSEIKRNFNVKDYIGEVLLSLNPTLKKTKHQIEMDCAEDLEINSYPGALSQIITNLVMNSITHAYDEGDGGKIIFRVAKNGENLIFIYSDDGKGISKENKEKIFDPFFTTKRGKGGTGLGLHIVFNLVIQTLSGTIECKSEPGKGSSFIIVFPIS